MPKKAKLKAQTKSTISETGERNTIPKWTPEETKSETKKHQKATTFLKKKCSLITSLSAKQNYNEESAPKMSMRKSTELLTTTTMATPSNDEMKKHQNAATFLKKS
ncbi:34799_t:CDS:2, partial [Gigaspora margarita]